MDSRLAGRSFPVGWRCILVPPRCVLCFFRLLLGQCWNFDLVICLPNGAICSSGLFLCAGGVMFLRFLSSYFCLLVIATRTTCIVCFSNRGFFQLCFFRISAFMLFFTASRLGWCYCILFGALAWLLTS